MIKHLLLSLAILPMAVSAQKKEVSPDLKCMIEASTEELLPSTSAAKEVCEYITRNSLTDDTHMMYTLPGGEVIVADYNDWESVVNFWRRVTDYNTVTEICNIPFGSTYEQTQKSLTALFGTCDDKFTTPKHIVYKNKTVDGTAFDTMQFMFTENGIGTVFTAAYFFVYATSQKEAVKIKTKIHEMLSKRYPAFFNRDGKGKWVSVGALPPTPTHRNDGYGIRLDIIDYSKDVAKSTGVTHVVRIAYGPYDYK